jgi:hypothetical protein
VDAPAAAVTLILKRPMHEPAEDKLDKAPTLAAVTMSQEVVVP